MHFGFVVDSLDSLGKSCFSGLWEDHFDSPLALVKEYVVNIWEIIDDSSQSLSLTGDLMNFSGIEGCSSTYCYHYHKAMANTENFYNYTSTYN